MERPERDKLLKEVVRILIEEGGQATIARLYFRLHSRFNIPFYEFAEEVRGSDMFVVTRPTGWENDLVSLKDLEPDRGPEGATRRRIEPVGAADSSRGRCGREE